MQEVLKVEQNLAESGRQFEERLSPYIESHNMIDNINDIQANVKSNIISIGFENLSTNFMNMMETVEQPLRAMPDRVGMQFSI